MCVSFLKFIGPTVLPRLKKRSYSKQVSNMMIHEVKAPTFGNDRPAKRNAISRHFLEELRKAIDQIHIEYDLLDSLKKNPSVNQQSMPNQSSSTTRVLIIRSAVDSCFCAGADLQERESFTAKETASFLADLRTTFSSLSNLPIPSISAISSIALGGGLELALCTSMRVLASNSEVGLPETRLGIIPGAGGTYRLPALIGLSRARDLILTGRRIDGREAYLLGLADRVIEISPRENETKAALQKRASERVNEAALILAFEICKGGPIAIRSALKAINYGAEEVENQMYEKVILSDDRKEALRAFREKRKPAFVGR